MPDFNRWLHEEMQSGPLDYFMDEIERVDYRQLEITRRANLIRDALAGRDRQDTNQPPQPFVLFGKPIDSTNFDEVLVAAATWGEMQSFLLRPSGLTLRQADGCADQGAPTSSVESGAAAAYTNR